MSAVVIDMRTRARIDQDAERLHAMRVAQRPNDPEVQEKQARLVALMDAYRRRHPRSTEIQQ